MDWETRKESICLWKHVVAGKSTTYLMYLIDGHFSLAKGSCAGVMEHVGMLPVDTIKVSQTLFLVIHFILFRHICKRVGAI